MADGDYLFDISDPSDWLNTPLASFAQVESGLRCQVCKDFYKTPMITTCGHTFCSLCIRHCYSSDQKCPACRAAGQETQLRKNAALEELVEAFQNARVATLEFARRPPSNSNIRSASPKRKLNAMLEEETSTDRPSKRTRSSSRRTAEPARTLELAEKSRDTISLLDDEDGEYKPESDMVECPVCLHKVKAATINSHLDHDCPPKPKSSTLRLDVSKTPKTSRRSLPIASTPARLPYLSYNGMKEHILKRKLTDLGIPSFGSKIEMQKRHTEWVAIWNSNCDAKHPKSTRELRTDLDTWERTQGALAPKSSGGIGSAIKDDNFDGSGWAATHHDEFSDLIARAKQKRAPPNSTPSSNLSTPTPSSAVLPPHNLGNRDEASSSKCHARQENIVPIQNSSLTRTEASSNARHEGLSLDDLVRPAEFLPMGETGIEPPFPSSQISRLKEPDEPNLSSSQFTVSPGSKRFFEDVDDNNLGVAPLR